MRTASTRTPSRRLHETIHIEGCMADDPIRRYQFAHGITQLFGFQNAVMLLRDAARRVEVERGARPVILPGAAQ